MALSLAEFRKCISGDGSGSVCELAAGTHEIDAALAIGRSNVEIRGVVCDGHNASILRRGVLASGQLFAGPLLSVDEVSSVAITHLDVDGGRFDNSEEHLDHRHPNNNDPASSLFVCPVRLPVPDVYAPPTLSAPFEADVFLLRASRIAISDMTLTHAVRHAIGIGSHSRDVAIDRVRIRGAGDYGVWAGFAPPDRPTLPLPDDLASARPCNLRFEESHIEDCGSAGIYLEAAEVVIRSCTLQRNHRDFPYDSDGGQLEIDYKSHDVTVESCAILDGPLLEREVLPASPASGDGVKQRRLFRCVGIEACGSGLRFRNNRIEGNSHEGIHLNGARRVTISGERTSIANNHTARRLHEPAHTDPVQNISITTTSEFAQLNAFAGDIQIEDITCENGILVWTNGSVERLRIDGVEVRRCNFSGAPGDGVIVRRNADGSSLRGARWSGMMKIGRSAELSHERHDSDKIEHGFLERYDPVLEPWLGKSIVLLELGVHTGGSLALWRDYFPLGTIVGIDIDLSRSAPPTERIHMYEGSQADTLFLSRVAEERAPDGFDIIIDDGSHVGELTKAGFWHLFDKHLKPGGLYVIEDWGTGYWDDWPDGQSLDFNAYGSQSSLRQKLAGAFDIKMPMPGHSYGMVGFLKQLVDEQAAHDVTRRNRSGTAQRESKFKSVTFTPSIVFVHKAGLV